MLNRVKLTFSFFALTILYMLFAFPLFADSAVQMNEINQDDVVTIESSVGNAVVVPGQVVKYTAKVKPINGAFPGSMIKFMSFHRGLQYEGDLLEYVHTDKNGEAVCEKLVDESDVGGYVIHAELADNRDYRDAFLQDVAAYLPATVNLITSSGPNATFVGDTAAFTAQVKASNDIPVSYGSIYFKISYDGSVVDRKQVDVVDGQAAYSYTFPKSGQYKITAEYIGNALSPNGVQELNFDIAEKKVVYGDLNCDGSIDAIDYALLKKYLLEQINDFPCENDLETADLDGDKEITACDYAIMHQYLLSKIDKFPVELNP